MVGFMEALKLQQFTAIDQNMLNDLQKNPRSRHIDVL